jgi:hypothetical protein
MSTFVFIDQDAREGTDLSVPSRILDPIVREGVFG